MKSKQKMFMKIFMKIKVNLILVTTLEIQSFLILSIIGKMKDEFKGKIISEFVGLKLKTYSLVTVDNEEIKKTNGVTKNVVKNTENILMSCLMKKMVRQKMKRIQNKLHKIGTYVCKFLCLVLMIKNMYWVMALIV